jgi:hypothetical protein
VEDTGVGIPPDQLEDIFSAFHQVEEKRVAQAEGIGLGLTVSQRLARMMGSELHVQSTLRKGSIFWFDLELAEVTTQKFIPPQEETEEEPQEIPAIVEESRIVPPPREEMALLWDLAMIGDILAIQERVKILEASDQMFRPFIAKLSRFAEELRMNEIQNFLQQFMEKEE